jgi:hypothetical protein
MNVAMFSIYYAGVGRSKIGEAKRDRIKPWGKIRLSYFLLSADFLLITFFFFVINYYKRGTFILSPHYENLLLVLFSVWLVCSMITGKFDRRIFPNYFHVMASCAKAAILMVATMSVFIFGTRMFYYSRGQIFGSFLMLLLSEGVLYYFYFILKNRGGVKRNLESVDEIKDFLEQPELAFEKERADAAPLPAGPVKEKLYHVLDFFNPWLFDFIDQSIDLSKLCRKDTAIVSSDDFFNLNKFDDNSLRLFINLHKTNDVRRVNRYFLEIYKKLKCDGYLIGSPGTIDLHTETVSSRNIRNIFGKFFMS